MARREVKVYIQCEYMDTLDVDEEDEHLSDDEIHDKFADEAEELLKEAVDHGWHEVTSVDVKVLHADA